MIASFSRRFKVIVVRRIGLWAIFLKYISDAFEELYAKLKAEFEAQLKEAVKLNKAILDNLAKIKIDHD